MTGPVWSALRNPRWAARRTSACACRTPTWPDTSAASGNLPGTANTCCTTYPVARFRWRLRCRELKRKSTLYVTHIVIIYNDLCRYTVCVIWWKGRARERTSKNENRNTGRPCSSMIAFVLLGKINRKISLLLFLTKQLILCYNYHLKIENKTIHIRIVLFSFYSVRFNNFILSGYTAK